MGPFSVLAAAYRRELKKFTVSGDYNITRTVFSRIYKQIRPQVFTKGYIWSGWKRSGIYPTNRDRIKALPEVQAVDRTTPEFQPPPATKGIEATPKKVIEVQALIERLQPILPVAALSAVAKLGKALSQELTTNILLTSEVAEMRKRKRDDDQAKRSAKITTDKTKRAFSMQEVIDGRARADGRKSRPTRAKTTPKEPPNNLPESTPTT